MFIMYVYMFSNVPGSKCATVCMSVSVSVVPTVLWPLCLSVCLSICLLARVLFIFQCVSLQISGNRLHG